MSATSVLYDAPGPRARRRNRVLSIAVLGLVLWAAWTVYSRFEENGQWAGEKWEPFRQAQVWENFLLPGIAGTLRAFATGAVLAIAFGLVFGVGRLHPSGPVRWLAGAVVEFFRAIPLVILMIFIYLLQPTINLEPSVFWAVVLGLMLYNGSVIAEVIRAGVNALPTGQSEAGLAIGLTRQQTLATILLPQAIRSMLPAIVAQLVVVNKDTALGYILAYGELLYQLSQVGGNYDNMVPAAMVIAGVYLVLNLTLSGFATWLERRLSRRGHTAGKVGRADAAVLVLPDAGMGGGGGGL